MAIIENGTSDTSHGIESSKPSENLNLNPNCDTLASENYKSNLVGGITETREYTATQNVENNVVSFEENLVGTTACIHPNLGAETVESQSVIRTKPSTLENAEVPIQNGIKDFENEGICPGSALWKPNESEIMEKDVENYFDQSVSQYKRTADQTRKRKSELKSPVTSSYMLRSKSQEKLRAPEPENTVKESGTIGEKKKRKKKQRRNTTTNEFARTRSHLRYLLHRIKYEQNLIDAYSGEGWKGQSLEKLKPDKELQRAKSHILHYKLKIRELFQRLDLSLTMGKLPESLFDAEGEIDSEDIFCAKCGGKDVSLDNDIILCDGACERGFHQFCLEPPLLKEDIPQGDEGWLCPGCDCKDDCIDILKDFQGTPISIVDSWEKIFPEAAAAASGNQLDDGLGSSSDDSGDEDYDPDKPDLVDKGEWEESSSKKPGYFSASEAASLRNEKHLELPSDESEDDDFDPTAPDPEKPAKQDSSSSDFTSDSEDLGALLDDTTASGDEETSKAGKLKRQSIKDDLSYLMENNEEPVSGKRHVERLDYKKLNDETYGNSSSDSSDEDFVDDSAVPKRRKKNLEIASSEKTPITADRMGANGEKQKERRNLPKKTRKTVANGASNEAATEGGSTASSGTKRAHRRLGEAATQRLYQSFKINQYPERAEREKLANELGLPIQQITKWYGHARWGLRHRPKKESNLSEKPPEPEPTAIVGETNLSAFNVAAQESAAVSTANHTSGNAVPVTGVERSGKHRVRKKKGDTTQAQGDLVVTSEAQERNAPESPQTRSSRRRTRSNSTVA